MRPADRESGIRLEALLAAYRQDGQPLPGIRETSALDSLVEQLLDSMHRIRYFTVLAQRPHSDRYRDPSDVLFDPLKAAILHQRDGNIDEAFWLVFLMTHFGKHRVSGWLYVKEIYGRLGQNPGWTWANTRANSPAFQDWLDTHQAALKPTTGSSGFGNHRKYESLAAYSPRGTGRAVTTYIDWIGPHRSHQTVIDEALEASEGDPQRAFAHLYDSMAPVARFGRTARFDYLTTARYINLAPVEPGSAYLQGATGPLRGACLLFRGDAHAPPRIRELDTMLASLEATLAVGYHVLEDALCNWQKSPLHFRRFRG